MCVCVCEREREREREREGAGWEEDGEKKTNIHKNKPTGI